MNTLKTAWQWLVYSSANAEQYSLTLKGALGALVTVLLVGAGFFSYSLDLDQITGLTSLIVEAFKATLTAISYIATAVSAWALVWGAMRKIILTLGKTV